MSMLVQNMQYIKKRIAQGERLDGRGFLEFRDITVENGIISKAEASARVHIGKTDVVVGVKIDTGTPFPDSPDDGIIMCGAEFSSIASPDFENGPPGIDSIELSRVIDRGIRESHLISTEKLCITPGEKVWMVFIDIHILNDAGNLLDAAGLAALIALKNAKMPKYDSKTECVIHDESDGNLPLSDVSPVPVTLYKINGEFLLDPSWEEKAVSDCQITVTTTKDGNITAMQKSESGTMSDKEVMKAIDLSVKEGAKLRKKLKL
ncbi:MAG: exosome complex protein Rrp42 [Candidatus Aenigmarchaeota archaeon]|nr:exosome complex protein Rrp42 [Candidatus Aenigmarchaeota archaeon]MCK5321862.1 exosome complex protein Rrp42 [Candidatus Aenigmarchaeota archaeon]